METLTLPVEFRLDLRATLAPMQGHFRPDGWWAAMRTADGPATLHLRRPKNSVEVRAFGPGAANALESVPGLIGAHDNPGDFVTDHRLVAELHRRHPGLRLAKTGRVFDALLVAILSQKVTGREAGRSIKLVHLQYSGLAPGPHAESGRPLQLPPDPERLAVATYFELHPLGIEQRRADILRWAAREAPRLDRLAGIDPVSACQHLERVPGIGVWTSAETVAVSHGDPDAVSVGDFHLKNEVAWHLTGRPRGTDQELIVLLEPFRPHRARVVRLLGTLGHAPTFGPRLPVRSIVDI